MTYYKCGSIHPTQNSNVVVDTASGAIANFQTPLAMPLLKTKFDVNAKQDLHGYDHPWPAGGGKNLFDVDNAQVLTGYIGSSSFNTNNSGARTTYIKISPSTTYTVQKVLSGRFVIATAETIPTNGAAFTSRIQNDIRQNLTITSGANDNYIWIFCYLESVDTKTLQEILNSIQVEVGSTATSWTPYSNICPIDGVSAVSVFHRGANLFDEVIELGSISNTTGEDAPNDTYCRSKNYIAVPLGQNLYISNENAYTLGLRFYDKNKTFIGSRAFLTSKVMTYGTQDLPTNTAFIRIVNTSTNTYSNDISINYPSSDTEYHAYNSNSNVILINLGGTYYGGHFTQNKDGHRQFEVTHKRIELASLTDWSRITNYTNPFFRATLPDDCRVRTASNNPQIAICDTYSWYISNQNYWQYMNNYEFVTAGFGVSSVNRVYIRNDDYTDKDEFASSLSGVYIVYELAEPFTVALPDGEPIKSFAGINNIYADTGDTSLQFAKIGK